MRRRPAKAAEQRAWNPGRLAFPPRAGPLPAADGTGVVAPFAPGPPPAGRPWPRGAHSAFVPSLNTMR
jgi:hypothetical protein